ncbi:OB-fold-containig protein [Flavobacterium sp. NRK1]|uniref:OB-fold-containig protein n=1 Tax=Flavobacterium sp. NRK1 TaxID=2954929 RepID=UPI0020926A14|nr:OB-fold-containig protein [Flavobacterium sp. NRK1]MCO6147946.1 YqiJ family protein [Flavobacterium sp. NRK1]
MKELIEISFSPVNAFFTIMSIIMVIYWLLVIIAGIDPDLFSVDFDSADIDVDTDLDIEADGDADGNGFIKILEYFNFDELPLMFIITIIFFSMWLVGVNITYYLGIESTLLGFLLIIPNFILSLFVVKLFSKPLGYLYKQVNHKGEPEIDFLGRRCRVVSSVSHDKTGQIELTVNGDPIKIYARSNTQEKLATGQQAVIVGESEDKKYYLVEKFDY